MSSRRLRSLAVAAAIVGVLGIVAAGVVLAGGGSGSPAQPTSGSGGGDGSGGAGGSAGANAGAPAPELAGENPITGEPISLADFKGKPVVINVWASWCPGCIAEAKDLRRFAAAHPEAVVLGIDFNDTKSGAKAFYAQWKWKHPSIFDPQGELAGKIGLFGLPSTICLNKEHREATRIVGETDFDGFEQCLSAAKA